MLISRTYTFLRRFCTFFGVILGGLAAMPAEAQYSCPHDAFHIRGVEVSAEAETGSAARNAATASGIAEAWQRLNARIRVDGGADDAGLDGAAIAGLLDYTSVVSETVLARNYIATFNYCFDRDRVRQVFAEKGIRHAEVESAPMLVLPVWHDGITARIWRRPNPWADAWREVIAGRDGLTSLKLSSTLAVERAVAPEDILAGQRSAIAEAARLENTERVIVTVISLASDGGDGLTVSASLYNRAGIAESEFFTNDTLELGDIETVDAMRGIAGEIERGLETVWRSVNAVKTTGGLRYLTVEIAAENLAVWRRQLDALRGIDPVERIDVLQLSPGGGVVRLTLSASAQSLFYALEANGYSITETGDDSGVSHRLVARDR